ncbi:alpha-L-rhamnosidase [Sulfolobus islandicus L.S.2.15]|uniref:alpha-L-rhamnosidase n=1 Tax=Saccharolobus islandicus (strain L.S.2.15 / Lassen \|nr:alpha-L-rhamnosidase [Sulfolobus islandicus]ACP36462.1 alpha-L-rhamnosidase [Sulfolobus islandicus L.S.2.15]
MSKIIDLRVEFTINPLGLDEPKPRFSWIFMTATRGNSQKAYRIVVGSLNNITKDSGDVWDSGIVESDDNIVEYKGLPLKSYTRYYWKVKVWDKEGKEYSSDIAWFEAGVIEPKDWTWIGGGQLMRKEFVIDKEVEEARVYISGLGYYELRINGNRVGDKALDPPWSEYTKTVYYSVYDVTKLIRKGVNATGVILGRGRFGQRFGSVKYYGEPRATVMLRVKLIDGSVVEINTDENWKCLQSGPIISDDIYLGFRYDARLELKGWDLPGFDDSSWMSCSKLPPIGKLRSSATIPATKVMAILKPRDHLNPATGIHVFDFGQNITGWVRVKVKGGIEGSEIRVRYAELLNPDGTLNTLDLRGAESTDVFILRGEEVEILEPRFTFHGFRYVEITGYPGTPSMDDVEAEVIHADLEPIGSFVSSNNLLNSIHRITLWSLKGNLMNGVETDCPQRDERVGWLGDAWLSSDSAVLNFNMIRYYEKFIKDIIESQKGDGSISDVAPPYWEIYPADPAWGTALIYIPWALYVYYNDKRILENSYDAMKKWWNYLNSMTKDGILYFNKYGDWVPPGRVRSVEHCPPEIISTWILYRDTKLLSRIAKILKKDTEAELFEEKAKQILEAFNRNFLSEVSMSHYSTMGYYSTYTSPDGSKVKFGGSQACNALPLVEDMVPKEALEQVVKSLVKSVEVDWDKHLNVGIIGAKYVPEALARYGYVDLAYDTLTQESYPSYGYMIKEGATTLWERWEKLTRSGMNSHNHHMFGSVDNWLYKYVAGLEVLEPSFKKVLIKPWLYKRLSHASASVRSIRGLVSVEWELRNSVFKLKATIPSFAEIHLPKISEKVEVLESGSIISEKTPGILSIKEGSDWIIVEASSGNYDFEVRSVKGR